ncbi:MAG: DsbA family protein [Propionibacteriaceae bacterium]|nr:DsbA family protein [Propionibacteriaceae bacterium]
MSTDGTTDSATTPDAVNAPTPAEATAAIAAPATGPEPAARPTATPTPQQASPTVVFDQRPLYLSIAALAISVITWIWVVLVPGLSGTDSKEEPAPPPTAPSQSATGQPQPTVPTLAPTGEQLIPPNLNADASAIIVNPRAGADVPLLSIHVDYQCPICKQAEQIWGETINELVAAGRIKVEYAIRSFLDYNLRNDSSRRAGVAAMCADTVGAFAAYHDVVFDGQPAREGTGYTDEQLRETFPAQVGITGAALSEFRQCFDGLATLSVVENMEYINQQNPLVSGTPTFLVNGVLLPLSDALPTDPDGFMAAVQQLLSQA